jgi:hypothetical protein
MSKLIDKLIQTSQTTPQPMGFRTTQPSSLKPKLLLIASLTPTDADTTVDYMAGVDAGLLNISKFSSDLKVLQKICQATPDIPWGVGLKNTSPKQIKQIDESGGDFVVFSAADTSLATLQDEKMGKILAVEPSLREGLLRVVNELPVNAVLVTDDQKGEYSLTWKNLILFQHFANLLTKPLLVPIPTDISGDELLVLWKAGVDGVLAEVGGGQPVERLEELHQVIDKLTFPLPRRRGKTEVLLSRISAETQTRPEEEEHEEE